MVVIEWESAILVCLKNTNGRKIKAGVREIYKSNLKAGHDEKKGINIQ